MKKFLISISLFFVLFTTGCKTATNTAVQQDTALVGNSGGGSGRQILPVNNDSGLEALSQGRTIQIDNADSFASVSGITYKDVEGIDVDNWGEYVDGDYLMLFSHPRDYSVLRDEFGDLHVFGGEGIGEFFTVYYGDISGFESPLRSTTFLINGRDFVLEEFEDDLGFKTISYRVINGQDVFRFSFSYSGGKDARIALFNRIIQTVRFSD